MSNRRISAATKQLRGKKVKPTVKPRGAADKPLSLPHSDGAELDALAQRFAEQLRPALTDMGTFAPVDEPLFMLMCRQLAIAELAYQRIRREAIFRHDENHVLRKHPGIQVMRDAARQAADLGKVFGLGALAREALTVKQPEEPDELERLLFGWVDTQQGSA